MSGVLVDANVLLDVLTQDSLWCAWSERQLRLASASTDLLINPLVYAELAAGFRSEAALRASLDGFPFKFEALPWEAAFPAGQAFLRYRRAGGNRTAPLPDFYIGAHAAVKKYRLLTRDARRYKTYFPGLHLIAP